MKSKHWLILFFVLLFAGMAGYMTINYLVDPLGYFSVEKKTGYYQSNQYTRAIKSKYIAENADQIDAVVIGGSKSGVLNTDLLSEYTGKNYYNYYFNVGNFSDYRDYITYLVKNQYVSEITLHLSSFEVDYFTAGNANTQEVPAIVSGNAWDQMTEKLSYLLTDVQTLWRNYKKIKAWDLETLDDVSNGERNRLKDYRSFAKNPVKRTAKKVTKNLNSYLARLFQQAASNQPAYDDNLNALREIKALCDKNGIPLHVVIGASFIGERDTYECSRYYAYLKEMVSITDVWDFSSFNDINLNPYNFVNRKHYNNAVGDLMIHTMYGGESYEGFGIYLTQDNIDDYLKQRKADFDRLKEEFDTTGTVELPGMEDPSYLAAVDSEIYTKEEAAALLQEGRTQESEPEESENETEN